MQGPEVPEDPHVNNAPARKPLEVFPDDMGYNRQVKPLGVRMTSGQQSFTCGGCASKCGTLRALMSKSTRIEHVPKLIICRSIENRCLNNLPCARYSRGPALTCVFQRRATSHENLFMTPPGWNPVLKINRCLQRNSS